MVCLAAFPISRFPLPAAFILAAAFAAQCGAAPTHAERKWTFENSLLRVSVNEASADWDVLDKRCNRTWRQAEEPAAAGKASSSQVVVKRIVALSAPLEGVEIHLAYAQNTSSLPLVVRLSLLPDKAELACEVSGESDANVGELAIPRPLVLDVPEGKMVVPHQAGLLFGVDELERHGRKFTLTMPWFGAEDMTTGQGYMAILETPDDAFLRGCKVPGDRRDVLSMRPVFIAQKGKLGYARRLLYHFLDRGGYVAMAKRYRHYAREKGLVKTLAEKRKERPAVDRLVGAVNIYGRDFRNMEEIKKLGIERAVVSGFTKDQARRLNDWGYLASHYDIYTDLYEPGTPPSKWERCEGFSFPQDVVKRADGSNQVGWCPVLDPRTGKKNPSYVICTTCGLRVLRDKMPRRLAESPYSAYFLDCVTASALYECHDPAHPLTRSADREARMRQFAFLSDDLGLVTGSEQGRGWAVAVADYFEGVMSTAAFFANPKEIHQMPFLSLDPDPRYARYEEYGVNPRRQVPLFQLVYGDCCETTWRWGDNSHRMPALWWKKDLLAIVHAAIPTWVLWRPQRDLFQSNTDRFRESYEHVFRWRRAVGYAEMIDHQQLARDGLVQRSSFANGASVTVNFDTQPWTQPEGARILLPPRSFLIEGTAPRRAGLTVDTPIRVRDQWQPRRAPHRGGSETSRPCGAPGERD